MNKKFPPSALQDLLAEAEQGLKTLELQLEEMQERIQLLMQILIEMSALIQG